MVSVLCPQGWKEHLVPLFHSTALVNHSIHSSIYGSDSTERVREILHSVHLAKRKNMKKRIETCTALSWARHYFVWNVDLLILCVCDHERHEPAAQPEQLLGLETVKIM